MADDLKHRGARSSRAVVFEGARSGRGPATWGQVYWRRQMETVGADDYSFNGIVPGFIEAGLPVDFGIDLVRHLFLRHDSLRTTHAVGPAGYEQVLHGAGQVPVIIETVDDLGAAAQVASALCDELHERRIDMENEFPLRIAFVVVNGLVHHFIVMISHLSADGTGMRLFANELLALSSEMLGTSAPSKLSASQSPLDEAAHQQSSAGIKHDERIRRRVIEQVRRAPLPLFPKPQEDRVPRFHYRKVVLHSSALLRASTQIAKDAQMTPSTVILAAATMAFARAARRDECALRLLVSNRFLPGLTEALSPLATDTPFVIDNVGVGADFHEVLPRVWKRSMTAFRNAYYDTIALGQQLASMPDVEYDDSCRYNDHIPLGPGAWEYQFNVPDGEIRWRDYPVREADDRALCLDVHDGGTGIELALLVDLHRVDAKVAEQLVRDVESILVEAAARGNVALARLSDEIEVVQ